MNHSQKVAYYLILALCSSSFIALLSVLLFFLCRNKPHRQLTVETPPPAKSYARPYTLIDIDTATEGFNPRRVIGEGRLGTVYAALSEAGELIAVKRIYPWLVLSNNNNAGFRFSSVIRSLSSAQHPNLVPITGYSEAPGERIVVMEYAGVVNLEFYLHQNPDEAFLLNWTHRVKIAAETARGIQYLHESMAPSVIHGCVKPSNILIDPKFGAKVSDYGLSFLAAREKRGVVGYVDDEYWKGKGGGNGSCRENDVYGFGVVLLELLSGRGCEEGWLVKWALPLIKETRLSELLDPRIEFPSDLKLKAVMRLGKVALACVGNCRKSRPVIGQVVAILNDLEIEVCV